MNLKDFWYVVAETKEVKPKQVLTRQVLGEKLAIFRNEEGTITALQDRCLHRFAQLSKGQVVNGKLQCPYHGWIYDSQGRVVNVPSEGPGAPKLRRCGKVFETRIHQDYVFVRLSHSPQENFEPYTIPNYRAKGWTSVRLTNFFKNNVTHCVENFVDIPHTVFVHPVIFRNQKDQKFKAEVSRRDGGVFVKYQNETSNLGITSLFLNPSGNEITHTDQFEMPNITFVKYEFGPNRVFQITSQSVPVSDWETLVYTDLTFNYGIWNRLAKPFVRHLGQKIIDQDIDILANQGEMVQTYGDHFSNSPADVIHVLIESIRNELLQERDPRKLPCKKHEIEFWI